MYEVSIAILGGLVVGCAILLCIYVTFKVDDRTDAVKNFPTKIVDAHHHFLDPTQSFHATLKTLGAPAYTPEQYADDAGTLPIVKTVHVEALADEGANEAAWVSSLADTGRCNVAAIVASCDLSADDAPAKLAALVAASPRVRGVRWILNYDGPFDGKVATATWPKVEADFLRDPARRDAFERGFAALAAHNLTFDLQCNPAQLGAAADLCARHPATRVVLDHLGTPRHIWMLKAGTVGGSAAYRASDQRKLTEWRAAMERFAELPHVYVKLSMIGYAVPLWAVDDVKQALARGMVREVIELFGARRCMFASNWHINAAISDSDGVADDGPSMRALFERFSRWTSDLSAEDRERLFAGTAEEFYGI